MRASVIILTLLLLMATQALSVLPPKSVHKLPSSPPATLKFIGQVQDKSTPWMPQGEVQNNHIWHTFRYGNSGTIAIAVGKPLQLVDDVNNRKSVELASIEFAMRHASQFGITGCKPVVESIHSVIDLTVVSLKFQVDIKEVYDGYLILSLNKKGAIASIKARGFGSQTSGSFIISNTKATSIALKAIGVKKGECKAEPIYFPTNDGRNGIILRAAFKVTVNTSDPSLQPVLFVDAESGKILAAENRVYHIEIEGNTEGYHFPLYGTEDGVLAEFPYELVDIAGQGEGYSDAEGSFAIEVNPDNAPFLLTALLQGRWAEVREFDENDGFFEAEVDGENEVAVTWDDENSRADERNLYFHVNFIHDFWVELDQGFDGLDYPLLAVCGIGGEGYEELEDNAMSGPGGIYFGRGNRCDNFALYADVVYHEYGHSVTSYIYRGHNLPYEGESGALNEAWSDYFPCSITDEPLMGEGGLMGANQYMRNLDNNLRYPIHIRNEVHLDGRIISAAMWHTREILGRDYADSLFHFARYLYGDDFTSYFMDVLLTADDDGDLTNGSPNYRVIYEQFGRHGIGLNDLPHFYISSLELSDDNQHGAEGNDNKLWEPGETIRINLNVFRAGATIPLEDPEVLVEISCNNPSINPLRPAVLIEEMNVGDLEALSEPLLFRIDDEAPLEFAELYITVSAGEGEPVGRDTVRIVLGQPSVLLVRDGSQGTDRSYWYHVTLDELGLVYSDYTVSDEHQPLSDALEIYPRVIWFTGNSREGILDDPSIDALETYLDNGGNLLLTGESMGNVQGAQDFFTDYLGVVHVADSLGQVYVEGVEDDPIGRGYQLLMVGGESARNLRRPGAIRAIEPAVEAYHWVRAEGQPAACVRRELLRSGSKVVYFSFGLESVGGAGPTNSRSEAINAVFEWFGEPGSVAHNPSIPCEFQLNAPYPNPFNGTIMIPLNITLPGVVDISVYDITGRKIWSISDRLASGSTVIPLYVADWGNGIYFLRASTGTKTDYVRLVLLK